jgi:hypothetical protein
LAAAAGHLLANVPRRLEFASPVVLAILGGAPLFAIATALPPAWIQHLRPGLQDLAEHQQSDDWIYVYPGAEMAHRYYAPLLGISTAQTIYPGCSIDDPRRHLRQLDGLRGERRVWIVITHEVRRGEQQFLLGYLDAVGTQLVVIDMPASSNRAIERASVRLYDLSKPSTHVDGDRYPLPPEMQRVPDGLLKWGCYGVTGGEPQR